MKIAYGTERFDEVKVKSTWLTVVRSHVFLDAVCLGEGNQSLVVELLGTQYDALKPKGLSEGGINLHCL